MLGLNGTRAPAGRPRRGIMQRLAAYLWSYKWHAAVSLGLTLLTAPLLVAGPPLTRAAIDLFIAPDAANPPSGLALFLKQIAERLGFGSSPSKGIAFIALLFLLANITAFGLQYFRTLVSQTMGQYIMYDLRRDIFAHLQKLPVSFYDRNSVGRLMARLTGDVETLNDMFTVGIIAIVGDLALIVYIVIYMFQANWRLALISFAIIPLLAILTIWFRIGARAANRQTRTYVANLSAFLQEHISSMHIVQLFNREEEETQAFAHINEAHREASIKALFFNAVFYPAIEIIGAIGIALIIWYGGRQVLENIVTIGTLIAFIQLASMFYEPISDMSEKYNLLQTAMASSELIFELLDEPAMVNAPKNLQRAAPSGGRIEFRHVWFAYQDEDWVLKDVSFIVEPGSHLAIVGHTGAGKTTITNLLLRFYDIQRGEILIDDVDIREFDLEELRSNFSIVLQDVFLFSGDITGNISLDEAGIPQDQVHASASKVRADEFIRMLPNGYATKIHERGAGLSVGQKQLISFARALAFDRRVFILDEATSSIDTETELQIREAISRLMQRRTAIIVAHRLSTIQEADKIIVLHKGEVREVGAHQDLVRLHGLYWRLHQLQFLQGYNGILSQSPVDD